MAPPSLPQPLGRLPGEPPSWDDDQPWHAYPRRSGRPQNAFGPEVLGLPASPASVGLARGAVAELLGSWGAGRELCEDAVLVVSELVTNALTHTGSDRVLCRLRVTADRLRIEVEDQNRGDSLPERREPDDDDQNGRGLMLVGALTTDWGVGNGTHGCVVWAELPWEPAELPLGATTSPAREAELPKGGTDSPGWGRDRTVAPAWEAELPTGESGSSDDTSRLPEASAGAVRSGRAIAVVDGGVSSLAAAPVPIPRPRVTSADVTRPVPRSAEGHLPHGTPAHP